MLREGIEDWEILNVVRHKHGAAAVRKLLSGLFSTTAKGAKLGLHDRLPAQDVDAVLVAHVVAQREHAAHRRLDARRRAAGRFLAGCVQRSGRDNPREKRENRRHEERNSLAIVVCRSSTRWRVVPVLRSAIACGVT